MNDLQLQQPKSSNQRKAFTIAAVACIVLLVILGSISNVSNPEDSESPRAYLSIASVSDQNGICGTNNLALNRPAHQSSLYANRATWVASRATDGNPTTAWTHCSCTMNDLHSWWAVDLGNSTDVCEVELTAITGLARRLANFVIFVSDRLPTTSTSMVPQSWVCAERVTPFAVAETAKFRCQGRGKYVGVQLRDQNWLQLCEVRVFGQGKTEQPCGSFGDQQSCETGTACVWNGELLTCMCRVPPKDIVFVVDGSSSISTQEFEIQRSILREMVKGVVPQGSRMGVIQFSDQVQPEINLLPGQSLANVLTAVNGMTQLMGNTHIGDAFQAALGTSFLGGAGITSESWIVLFTDGNTNGGVSPCTLTQSIRSISGLHVLVIGVTSGFDKNGADIACLVANEPVPANNIIFMQQYSLPVFQQAVPSINRKICTFQ